MGQSPPQYSVCKLGFIQDRKDKEKCTLFSDHTGSLLRRQLGGL
jgi:hypothetical protein